MTLTYRLIVIFGKTPDEVETKSIITKFKPTTWTDHTGHITLHQLAHSLTHGTHVFAGLEKERAKNLAQILHAELYEFQGGDALIQHELEYQSSPDQNRISKEIQEESAKEIRRMVWKTVFDAAPESRSASEIIRVCAAYTDFILSGKLSSSP